MLFRSEFLKFTRKYAASFEANLYSSGLKATSASRFEAFNSSSGFAEEERELIQR